MVWPSPFTLLTGWRALPTWHVYRDSMRRRLHGGERREKLGVLARGRTRAGVAKDDETGVPRAAMARLALLVRIVRTGRCRAGLRLERRVGDPPLLHRPTDIEQARRRKLRDGGGHRNQGLVGPRRGCDEI